MTYQDARDQFIWQFATWKGHCIVDIGETLLKLYSRVGGPYHPDYGLERNIAAFNEQWKALIEWPTSDDFVVYIDQHGDHWLHNPNYNTLHNVDSLYLEHRYTNCESTDRYKVLK